MNPAAPVPIVASHDVELDPGTVEFAIGRVEALSARVRRNALITHRADFYQIVWITGFAREGMAWIDLDCYPLRPPMMCFISPGQIRAWDAPTWQTTGAATGYVIDFTQGFFSDSPGDANPLIQLPYFHGVGAAPVLYVNEEQARLFTVVCSRLERETQLALDGQSTLMRPEFSNSRAMSAPKAKPPIWAISATPLVSICIRASTSLKNCVTIHNPTMRAAGTNVTRVNQPIVSFVNVRLISIADVCPVEG